MLMQLNDASAFSESNSLIFSRGIWCPPDVVRARIRNPPPAAVRARPSSGRGNGGRGR